MLALKAALRQEKDETREMLNIYKRHARGEASKEELAAAHAQFLDIVRGIGLGVFAILPFAPITIPIIVKLGRMVGVEVIPSAFLVKKPKITKQQAEAKLAEIESNNHNSTEQNSTK